MGAPLLKFLLNFRLNLRDWGSTSPRVEGRPRRRLRRGRTTRGKRVPHVPINVQICTSKKNVDELDFHRACLHSESPFRLHHDLTVTAFPKKLNSLGFLRPCRINFFNAVLV